MSLRIVLSHHYAWPEVRRGGERYLHELGAALQAAGHRVHILASAPSPGRGEQLGVPVIYLKRRRFRKEVYRDLADEVAFGLEAGARMAISRADVWHAFGASDAASAAAIGSVRGWRAVYTNLGLPMKAYWDSRTDTAIHELVVRRTDSYLCLSRSAGQWLVDDYHRQPDIVGGGVDLTRFAPAARRHPRPALLFSGAILEPRKNVALLLEAVALLRQRRPTVELWLSGPGDATTLLAAAPPAGAAAAVLMGLGTPDEAADLYRRAWVTVLPSRDEAFGLALLESLACGTPIVALADGGGPAELVHDGIGFTCEGTAEALADACDRALDLSTTSDIAERCRSAAAEHDWRGKVVPQLESIYSGGGVASHQGDHSHRGAARRAVQCASSSSRGLEDGVS